MIRDIEITKIIVKNFLEEFLECLELDVAIAGAGPSGLTAARYLAKNGKKVVVFERKLAPGGGMWGGGIGYPYIVMKQGKELLEEVGIKCFKKDDYWVANSIEAVSKLVSSAIDSGAKIFNGMTIEDVMIKSEKINGVVINWSAIKDAGLHVDPVAIEAKCVIDATGHDCNIARIVEKKYGLATPSKKIEGEKAMWADEGEKKTVENTKEIFPGLYVTGMAANAVFGAPRMGPIFGGMLLSGKKVAELIIKKI
ncbi:MAG: thiazole biosynthesis protein [Thermoplasmatales archaeon]|nr:thiazole biosynthesis protein [Thermoplasmatales archaeon]